MKTSPLLLLILALCFRTLTAAESGYGTFFPGTRYDESIPSPAAVIGHGLGERITTHGESEIYLKALAAAGDRVRLFSYGRTWEGRSLYYLVIASPERLSQLERIKADQRELAHPLSLDAARRAELLASAPAVCWLAATVHGNESSGMDACLFLAYHLAAARGDTLVDRILRESVVLIDPLQNPDGHDRFAAFSRGATGRWPSDDPFSACHREPWPGGRTNHYLFDMNRDWYVLTQIETRGKVEAFLEWYPHVYVDLHEMGGDWTYYFPPTSPPFNRYLTTRQMDWYERVGRNNSRWFDSLGFRYYTRESFDAYFPGYGCTWPSLSGAVGMTFEQASTRGLLYRRDDESVLTYRRTIHQQVTASLSTLELAARERARLIEDFAANRTPPSDIGAGRAYLIPEGLDPGRVRKLVGMLLRQGIRVERTTGNVAPRDLTSSDNRRTARRDFPSGTFVVRARQEEYAKLSNILEPEVRMGDDYVAEQERRLRAGLGTQVYDVTAWSLPGLYDIECWRTESLPGVSTEPVSLDNLTPAPADPGRAKVAWVLDGRGNSTMAALASLQRSGARIYVYDQGFRQGGREYSRGSFLLPTAENPDSLPAVLDRVQRETGARFDRLDSGWTDEGLNPGSPNVRHVPAARVLLAWGESTHYGSPGWARFVLERDYGVPVTTVRVEDLGRIDIRRYNVLVLPEGWYGDRIDRAAVERLKGWIGEGGTLVGIGNATAWLADSAVGLLPAVLERRLEEDSADRKDSGADRSGRAKGTEITSTAQLDELVNDYPRDPQSLPGVLLRARLDADHWLSCGYDSTTVVFSGGNRVYRPLTRAEGRNVVHYEGVDKLLVSGHVWPGPSLRQIAYKPFLLYAGRGQGHVIGFAEEPNFRAVTESTARLFMNAVLLGPAH